MKTVLVLVVSIVVSIVLIGNLYTEKDGEALGHEAASTYCSMVRLQHIPGSDLSITDELEDLKLKHGKLMERGYSLKGENREKFSKTYSSMVAYCN
jgi:hypothetical protein